MSSADLNPVSYVVLGLLARDGAATAYELKLAVERGIALFWPFPRSQLYSEAERLSRLGLLSEEREQSGRRRRVYRITRSGHAALRAWLGDPAAQEVQYRSLALLKLFFGQFSSGEDIAALAEAELASYEQVLGLHEQALGRLRARGDRPWQLAVGELLIDAHRAAADHWKRIARHADRKSSPRRGRARQRAST
ncbi:MAG TPA: helix-turn-helix transcriptional regulator [Kofleriaceae bacterium]|nr:helix-turn-helix transcriptional regulator [Kofleriaceae bacterium]